MTDKPSMIACKTIIGFGFPTKAGTQKAHSDAPGEDEIAGARKILGWDSPPFVIPDKLLSAWREIGAKGRAARMAWADRVKAAPAERRAEMEARPRPARSTCPLGDPIVTFMAATCPVCGFDGRSLSPAASGCARS